MAFVGIAYPGNFRREGSAETAANDHHARLSCARDRLQITRF